MRSIELFEQLLLEHNVVNTDAIKRYVSNFAAQCENENAKEWFNVVLARYLERDDHTNVKMTDATVPRNAPDWLEDALARGDDLRVFNAPVHMNPAFDHLCDYFNYLNEHNDPVMSNRDRVLKITVQNALNKADEWTEQAGKKASKQAVEGCKVVGTDGAYRWVQPETLEALRRDGAILHQCTATGTYDDQFKKGTMRFYILHDSKGQPHVCISVQKSGELDQVKGKQNKAPIGRYAQLCARFLDKLSPTGVDENFDVKKMGLTRNAEGQLVTAVEATGTCVYKIDKVRVFETQGEFQQISTHSADYYGGSTHKNFTGSDYWFNSSEGDLFKIKVADGFAYLNLAAVGVTAPEMRALAMQFLNNYFTDGAPPPLQTAYNSATKNYLVHGDESFDLDLRYNYLNKKYGQPNEVGERAFEIDGFDGYFWSGRENNEDVEVYQGRKRLFVIPYNESKVVKSITWSGYQENGDTELNRHHKGLIAAAFNKLELHPYADISDHDQTWRENIGLYYSKPKKLWGDLAECCEKVWEKGDFSMWKRQETGDPVFAMMKVGQLYPVFELTNDARIRDVNGVIQKMEIDNRGYKTISQADTSMIGKLLAASLNASKELEKFKADAKNGTLSTYDRDFDEYDLFFSSSKDKWESRDKAGQLLHKFDDGFYFTEIGVEGRSIYSLYNSADKPVLALTIKDDKVVASQKWGEAHISAARHVLWLMNSRKVKSIDTVDATDRWNQRNEKDVGVRALLWHLGLFHDARSLSWKLVQDGKLIHAGPNYRAVNFRNRLFIIDDADGVLGYAKKEGNLLGEPECLDKRDERQFLVAMKDLHDSTDYKMPFPDSEHTRRHLRRHGLFWKNHSNDWSRSDKRLHDAHAEWPEQVVLKMPKGYEWVRMPVDNNFHSKEQDDEPHGESYSLRGADGETFMRANFDGDYLQSIWFSAKDTFDSYHATDDLSQMKDGPQKKWFLALCEKLDRKLTPSQVKKIGWYRTKTGKYASLASKPLLNEYLQGRIVFPDGHVFKAESSREKKDDHDNEYEYVMNWELGHEFPDAQFTHERFKPYIRVTLDDEGIRSVKYLKKDVKRKPKEYMPYIHKLMQIFSTISGD